MINYQLKIVILGKEKRLGLIFCTDDDYSYYYAPKYDIPGKVFEFLTEKLELNCYL